MKTCRTRLEEIAAAEPLLAAWRRYRAGKRRRPGIAWFELSAESRLLALSERALAGTYVHAPYRVLAIRDPKPRLIAVAAVADRVVHRAVYDALAPFFERRYIADSYACLNGRGSHRAILSFLARLRRFTHVLHLDIRSYFPSVDHGILRGLLEPRLRDRRVGQLLTAILASGCELYARPEVARFYSLDPARLQERPQGLPIGNLTSQWWGNLYLDGLDHFVQRSLKVPGYLRYMDDLMLFAHSPTDLRAWRAEIGDWLRIERRLVLKDPAATIRPATATVRYLGYRIHRGGTALGKKSLAAFRQRLPAAAAAGARPSLRQALASWRAVATF